MIGYAAIFHCFEHSLCSSSSFTNYTWTPKDLQDMLRFLLSGPLPPPRQQSDIQSNGQVEAPVRGSAALHGLHRNWMHLHVPCNVPRRMLRRTGSSEARGIDACKVIPS